jgi:lysophospholipase L1-like esterase
MNWETLLCLGDSITIGARSYLGYPDYAADYLKQKTNKNWLAVNYAVSGYTTIQLARHMVTNYDSLEALKPLLTTILIGTNDVKAGTNLELYKIALDQTILLAKLLTLNKNVVLIKIPQLGKGVMYPYNYEMNERVAAFNIAIEEKAHEHNCKLIDLQISDDDYYDGVHLHENGSQKAAQNLSDYICKERGLL